MYQVWALWLSLFFFARADRGMTLDFISGSMGPLSFDIWGQDFPKAMLQLRGISVLSMGPVAIIILLPEATEEITLDFISGALGPLSFNMWGSNCSKALQGLWATSVPSFVPCGYCSFFC